ncbi:MAG: hypothetical protein SF069_09760 [Phycisphaerae bacterium]|nr:hypothetical protein [Phycisphaerae bacterium]
MADEEVLQANAERWFASHQDLLLLAPPRQVLARIGNPACSRIALRRYLLRLVLPSVFYLAWVALWSQFSLRATYNRWWEMNNEPGVRRDVDQTHGFSLALADPTDRDQPYLPTQTFTPWHDRRFHWEFARISPAWRPHWPRADVLAAPALLLALSTALRIGLYWSLAACSKLSTPAVRRARHLQGAWNLATSHTCAYAIGIGIFSVAVAAAAIMGTYLRGPELAAPLIIALMIGALLQLLCSVYLSAAIGSSCGIYIFRTRWRTFAGALSLAFASIILVAAVAAAMCIDALQNALLQ